MKILNKPIKVMAVFHTDGEFEPIKFRVDEKVVRVDRIVRSYEEHIVGSIRIVFVCIQNEKDTYEQKYKLDSKIWYRFKK